MYLGDKFRSPAKPSRCIEKRYLDLKITSVDNGQLHFPLHVSEFESNSEGIRYSSTCILAKKSVLEEWKLQQQPKNQGYMEI